MLRRAGGSIWSAKRRHGPRRAHALRTPLLAIPHTIPGADRAQWLASLVAGLQQSVTRGAGPDASSEAYKVGQRMGLLITEEGHA
ncbi:hypothetical protein ACIQVK_18960 [Streptomyces sp. NPDC090493]|uniref:hypothetical protein n=1 Tax=Streptomyces sp. NPDC090493 TaxID=3365964 RepID=UPI003815E939